MAETTATTFHTISFHSSSYSVNSSDRYDGLIKRSLAKKTKIMLVNLFSYVYSVAPTFVAVHNVISVVRLLQLVGPCFGGSFDNLWEKGTKDRQIINIISILFQIIPVNYIDESFYPFTLFYIIFTLLILVFLLSCAYYFDKNANLPTIVTGSIAFYFASFAMFLHPIAFVVVFTKLSDMIYKSVTPEIYLGYSFEIDKLVLIVITILLSLLIIILTDEIAGRTLTFRPNSFLTVSMNTWKLQYFEPCFIVVLANFASGFLGELRWVSVFLLAFTALFYGAFIGISYFKGGFIQKIITNALCATNGICFIITVVNIILIIMKKPVHSYILFVFCFGWVALFILFIFINSKYSLHALSILDDIGDNSDQFYHDIKSPNNFLNFIKIGFSNSHPFCINWSLCKMAVDRWPRNADVWFAFAKFTAIYPEETQKLEWIYITVRSAKIRGSTIQTIKEQSRAITRQRETALSNDLKMRISKLTRDVNSTKHKLRHVWDSVLQGNVSEVEDATKRVAVAIKHNSIDFQRLLRQFPNNRFVTRPYARFLIEIVGDNVQAADVLEKTRLLQRGICVNADQTHVFGMNAFPNLPDHVSMTQISSMAPATSESNNFSYIDFDPEGGNNLVTDNIVMLKDVIEKVKIPAVKNTLIMRYLLLTLFFILPLIVMLIIVNLFVNELCEPLNHMENLALVDTYATNLVAFANRWIFVCLKIFAEIDYKGHEPPSSLGSFNKTSGHLHHTISQLSEKIQTINEFRNFRADNEIIQKAQNKLFSKSINYSFYVTDKNITYQMLSTQNTLVDFVMQISSIVGYDSAIVPEIIVTSCPLNLYANLWSIRAQITESMDLIIEYIKSIEERYRIITIIAVALLMFFYTAVCIISLVVQTRWIRQNKEVVYNCLTSLPKNHVSQLAENLRVLKKENSSIVASSVSDNIELSKQEDNILKIFNTGGSAGIKLGDLFFLTFISVVILALEIASTFMICQLIIEEIDIVLQTSPQIIYVQEQYTSLMNVVHTLDLIAIQDSYVPIPIHDLKTLYRRLETLINESTDYYTKVRYGTDILQPYKEYQKAIDQSSNITNCTYVNKEITTYRDSVECFNNDLVYTSMFLFIQYCTVNHTEPDGQIDSHNEIFNDIWYLCICRIYDQFIYPVYFDIKYSIRDNMNATKTSFYSSIIVMMIIGILFELMASVRIILIENHIKFVLKLLLHCKTEVINQVPKIMAVLNGAFSSTKLNTSVRNESFFDNVLMNLPEAIIISDNNTGNVETINKQCCNLLNIEPENLISKPISDVIKMFEGESAKLLQPNGSNVEIKYQQSKNFHKVVSYSNNQETDDLDTNRRSNVMKISPDKNQNNKNKSNMSSEIVYFNAFSLVCNQKLAIILRDETSTVRYNTLIQQEKLKSDGLLSSILPVSLVPRVQAGEKDISFSIQTATIVFMDIVSFTPWCGSLPADKVMLTLNLLFKKLDSCLNKYSTMTKIKCIGDCYMAAGGVFAEVNHPAEHAKEVVNFGLDALDAITELNKELNEKLQIRVGINTGGPIVAGVLGIGKPTFEILGPAINMAQQMEHHGIPMKVHISRNVYELIYGDSFIVKERGVVEVKGGSVVTYIVQSRK